LDSRNNNAVGGIRKKKRAGGLPLSGQQQQSTATGYQTQQQQQQSAGYQTQQQQQTAQYQARIFYD
jgi:hypothetical protein